MNPKQRLEELKRQAQRETLEHFFGDAKKANSLEGRIILSGIETRLIEEEKKVNPDFAAFAEKRQKKNMKLFAILGFCFLFFVLILIIVAVSDEPVDTQKPVSNFSTTDQKEVVYPQLFMDYIKAADEEKGTKIQKFRIFDLQFMNMESTKPDMQMHSKVVLDAYKSISFEDVQKLDDMALYKQMYSAQVVNRYFVNQYSSQSQNEPIADLAYDYYQIAREAYCGILTREFYDSNKSEMDAAYAKINNFSSSDTISAHSPMLYPPIFFEAIKIAENTEDNRSGKYSAFEFSLINITPSENDMKAHSKIVIDAYKTLSFEGIQKLDDETVLKQIYSARVVERYFIVREEYSPQYSIASDYLQVARDAYRQMLTQEFYDANKSQMDKQFASIQP